MWMGRVMKVKESVESSGIIYGLWWWREMNKGEGEK